MLHGFYCSYAPCWELASGQCDICKRRLCHEHKVRRGSQVACEACDRQQMTLQGLRDVMLKRPARQLGGPV